MSKAVALCAFLSTGMVLGFFYGRATSIDWNQPSSAQRFIARYAPWENLDNNRGQLTLEIGNERLTYTTGDSVVQRQFQSADVIAGHRSPRKGIATDFQKLAALAVAPPIEGGALAWLLRQPMSLPTRGGAGFRAALPRWQAVVIGVATLGSAAFGYRLGYETEPDVSTTAFRNALGDISLWKSVEEDWRRFHRLAINVQGQARMDALILNQISGRASGAAQSLRTKLQENAAKRAEISKMLSVVFELHPEIATQAKWDMSKD